MAGSHLLIFCFSFAWFLIQWRFTRLPLLPPNDTHAHTGTYALWSRAVRTGSDLNVEQSTDSAVPVLLTLNSRPSGTLTGDRSRAELCGAG